MNYQLKVKAKSLAAESKIIKQEKRVQRKLLENRRKRELNADGFIQNMNSLDSHNKDVVAIEARATHLARAFLSGRTYDHVEKKRIANKETIFRSVVLGKVMRMVMKYGDMSKYHNMVNDGMEFRKDSKEFAVWTDIKTWANCA